MHYKVDLLPLRKFSHKNREYGEKALLKKMKKRIATPL